jgi:hypothetical protein
MDDAGPTPLYRIAHQVRLRVARNGDETATKRPLSAVASIAEVSAPPQEKPS